MSKVLPTAAQYFNEEADFTGNDDISDRVVTLLNEAATSNKDQHKLQNLRTVQELIIQRDAALLDNFLDEVLSFQNDRSVDVRKFLVEFMEQACRKDPAILSKVVANLYMMLNDGDNPNIQKRAIQACTHLYKICLKWICSSKSSLDVDDIKKSTWDYFQKIGETISSFVDSYNDGVRTLVIKFMEMVVISQTFPDSHSPPKGDNDFSLDDIPTHVSSVLKLPKLEEQAKKTFEAMIVFHGTQHISSVNLMACTQSLVIIARHRSEFMSRIISAMETLHANLPPTLAKSQVSSVRKHIKMQLFILSKHPVAVTVAPQIMTLLTDLGATSHEIHKHLSQKFLQESSRKRIIPTEAPVAPKKIRVMADEDEDENEAEKKPATSRDPVQQAIDMTALDIQPLLTTINVTDIVLYSMTRLPDVMPAHFQATYTPISVAGTEGQISHLSRLMATQMTAVNLGKGVEEIMKKAKMDILVEDAKPEIQTIQTIGTAKKKVQKEPEKENPTTVLLPAGAEAMKKRARHLNLSEVTKPISKTAMDALMVGTVKRLLRNNQLQLSKAQQKTIAGLAMQHRGEIAQLVREYIFTDVKNNVDLVMIWLFEEYTSDLASGVKDMESEKKEEELFKNYNQCLNDILMDLLINVETKDKDCIIQRIFMEAPVVTPSAIDILQQYCQNENAVNNGLNILRSLIEYRPSKQKHYLDLLLKLTVNHMQEVRTQAVRQCIILHESNDHMMSVIEDFALSHLKALLDNSPPTTLYPTHTGNPDENVWLEDDVKLCITLYLALLSVNQKLIHELIPVYIAAPADTKRTILRTLEAPIRNMGMDSPELLQMVETCPAGSENLITRIIHILTDKTQPSQALVTRVRDLYNNRVSDVRFLIPVLTGLTKKEIINALPMLIKLNPNVVKEVFNRLFSCKDGPVSPSDVLVALHNIDTAKCDMKTVIKATAMCFAEKTVFTQEVLAVVLQQLMEQTPLPTLLMRTVIQSLSLFPRLMGFVMSILQRLITRQVWKYPKVWEGFIKCCERTTPQSLNVIIQLPPDPLKELFDTAPRLKDPMVQHVTSLTQTQRSHIPSTVLKILFPEDIAAMDKDEEVPYEQE